MIITQGEQIENERRGRTEREGVIIWQNKRCSLTQFMSLLLKFDIFFGEKSKQLFNITDSASDGAENIVTSSANEKKNE